MYSIQLLDESIQEVEDTRDELLMRFIKQIHKAIRNKYYIDDFGKKFYPFTSETNRQDTIKLDKLLWELPEGYINPEEDIDFEDLTEINNIDYDGCIPF